jgi:hypothetical protein
MALLAVTVGCRDVAAPAPTPQLVPGIYNLVSINQQQLPVGPIGSGVLVLWDDSTYTDALRMATGADSTWSVLYGRVQIVGIDSIEFYPAASMGVAPYGGRVVGGELRFTALGLERRLRRAE